MKIAVLCLQGAFLEHIQMLKKIDSNIDILEIRNKDDLEQTFDALIIPGGESTTMKKLLSDQNMLDLLKYKISNGLATFGTCAGMILLAKKLKNYNEAHLEVLDIEVERNAYGRQSGSFKTINKFKDYEIPMTFIRAPRVSNILSDDVNVLSVVDNKIVAVEQKNILATAFHPELTNDETVHRYFLEKVKSLI